MIDDPHFIDAMVQELKSQGLFDQFRKECLADVDTKPAYQNLRQRVEGTVNKFLGQQEWSDNIRYKNQLRDQLRKNIIESGFLDAGVERIVDQVVNPKIATIFQPKVEEIVYNYLGIEKPKSSFNGNEHASVCAESLLEDLEAISPDSDKKSEGCLTPSPPPPQLLPPPPEPAEEPLEHVVENMDIDEDDEALDESKEQDDFESPAFEPLEVRSPSKTKDEMNDSNSSAISGLTSQESVKSDDRVDSPARGTPTKEPTDVLACDEQEYPTTKDSEFSQEIGPANDSQLSQVSSNSQLLTATAPSSSEEMQPPEENERLDITEEAQMPTLFSSSMDKVSSSNEGENEGGTEVVKKITFDFKKDEYDFVGTGRPSAAITCADESFGDGNRERDQEDDSTPTETPMETPTDTPEKLKDNIDQPNLTLQDEETSQSEHSLKICEDTFSDDNTKDSRSQDGPASAQDSPSKIKGLSDASSCSVKSDEHAKSIPSTQTIKIDKKPIEAEQTGDAQGQEAEREDKNDKKEAEEQNGKTITVNKDDDHYQEHQKHQNDRRSSDRDSEDGNDKHGSGGSGPPPASEEIRSAEDKLPSSEESNGKAPEKAKSPAKDAADAVQSPSVKELDRNCRSMTPTGGGTAIDSSSSGIQSGDDSEKSPETLKSYSKSESIVLPVQPVVIDQMLTSADDSEIERLLSGETKTNDATLESLQRQWQSTEGKIRKPIFASNFYEARRLIRVRKQIQRHEQKCRAQALAMAKKYINENKAFAGRGMEDQGIELEFVCDGKRKSPGPLISSPVPKVEQPTVATAPKSPVSDPELLYFPEAEEVYRCDEKRLDFLRSKTDGVTFGKNFKVQHYSTMIYSLAASPTRVSKRPTTSAFASAKIRRTEPMNGIAKNLELGAEGGKNGTTLAIRKQRSIRNRLVEKSTPPSVGTDA